jgi:hypothetical protein
LPLRIASTLCWIVGVITLLGALAIGIPASQAAAPTIIPLLAGLIAGIAVIAAAILVRRARRLGGILILVATTLPSLIILAAEDTLRAPPLLLLLAAITVLANWTRLR